MTIPVVQEAKAGSFDGGNNISVASASTDLQLAFKNVGSLVKFSMTNDKASDVRTVKLTSNGGNAVLAGTVNINVGATPTVTPVSSQNQVTLKSDAGFEAGEDYYFMVLPGTLSDGFSLTFTDKDGLTWQKTYTAEASMNRSNILKLNAIELGTFTTGLLTNLNLIAAAEACSGQIFTKNTDGTVSLLNPTNLQIVQSIDSLNLNNKKDPYICEEIGFFSNLEYLSCGNNGITSLDLSKNTLLKDLRCWSNQLTSLDLAKNAALTNLECENNQLTSLNLANNTELINLDCTNNQLTNLNLVNNTELINLACTNNQLAILDLSNNTELKQLYCSYNQLTSLDLTNNTALTSLYCYDNQLTILDLTNNAALTNLQCGNNQLTSLDLANNTALNHLHCGRNQLTSLDLANNTALIQLYCYNNQLINLDVANNPALTEVWCHHNQLASLDISNNNQINWENLYVGCQTDVSNYDQVINLYVNADQLSQILPDADNNNKNVNILLKSDATHEGYNEIGY